MARNRAQRYFRREGALISASFFDMVAVVLGTPVAVYTPVGKLLVLEAPWFDAVPLCLVVEFGALVIMLAGGVPGIPASVLKLGSGVTQSPSLLNRTPLMMTPPSLASTFF